MHNLFMATPPAPAAACTANPNRTRTIGRVARIGRRADLVSVQGAKSIWGTDPGDVIVYNLSSSNAAKVAARLKMETTRLGDIQVVLVTARGGFDGTTTDADFDCNEDGFSHIDADDMEAAYPDKAAELRANGYDGFLLELALIQHHGDLAA